MSKKISSDKMVKMFMYIVFGTKVPLMHNSKINMYIADGDINSKNIISESRVLQKINASLHGEVMVMKDSDGTFLSIVACTCDNTDNPMPAVFLHADDLNKLLNMIVHALRDNGVLRREYKMRKSFAKTIDTLKRVVSAANKEK